jgi:hypothetical protein
LKSFITISLPHVSLPHNVSQVHDESNHDVSLPHNVSQVHDEGDHDVSLPHNVCQVHDEGDHDVVEIEPNVGFLAMDDTVKTGEAKRQTHEAKSSVKRLVGEVGPGEFVTKLNTALNVCVVGEVGPRDVVRAMQVSSISKLQ